MKSLTFRFFVAAPFVMQRTEFLSACFIWRFLKKASSSFNGPHKLILETEMISYFESKTKTVCLRQLLLTAHYRSDFL